MLITIKSKNFTPDEKLKATIEKKMSKLDKYFSKETEATVMLSGEKNHRDKLEATIYAGGMIFRAEESNTDIYYCLDKVMDKLSLQMSRFKDKLVKRHKDHQTDFVPAELPEIEEKTATEISKTKKFRLNPMSEEEAVLQMELIDHNFFVFLNSETNDVNVVYKRNDGSYGLLETEK